MPLEIEKLKADLEKATDPKQKRRVAKPTVAGRSLPGRAQEHASGSATMTFEPQPDPLPQVENCRDFSGSATPTPTATSRLSSPRKSDRHG